MPTFPAREGIVELILEYDDRRYHLLVIDRDEEFAVSFAERAFPCLLWDVGTIRDAASRSAVAARLVAAGCRYAVCGGRECQEWHDAVDEAFLAQDLDGEEYDRAFVMTTWHTGESQAEVAKFFVNETNFEAHDFRDYLVLQLGTEPMVTQCLREVIADCALTREPGSAEAG